MITSFLFASLAFSCLAQRCSVPLDVLLLQDINAISIPVLQDLAAKMLVPFADILKSHPGSRFGIGWLEHTSIPTASIETPLSHDLNSIGQSLTNITLSSSFAARETQPSLLSGLSSNPLVGWNAVDRGIEPTRHRVVAVSTEATVRSQLLRSLRILRDHGIQVIVLSSQNASEWESVAEELQEPVGYVQTVKPDLSDIGRKFVTAIDALPLCLARMLLERPRRLVEGSLSIEGEESLLSTVASNIEISRATDEVGCERCFGPSCEPCGPAMYVKLAEKPAVVRLQMYNQ